MGCAVNGPGEAKGADIGVACGKGKGVIFAGGSILKTVRRRRDRGRDNKTGGGI